MVSFFMGSFRLAECLGAQIVDLASQHPTGPAT